MNSNKRLFVAIGKDHIHARSVLMLQSFLTLMIILYENVYLEKLFTFSFFLQLLIFFSLYSFLFKAQKRLNYSFWGMSSIIILFLLQGIVFFLITKFNPLISLLNLLSLFLLLGNMYMMSSPLFYPRVQWWEYDFRYRGDLKVSILLENRKVDARITDIRRTLGSLESFENFNAGEILKFELDYNQRKFYFHAQIMTMKVHIPGRPVRYGLRFIFDKNFTKKEYKTLIKTWDDIKKVKIREKFKNI
jgi:hypothetical protein